MWRVVFALGAILLFSGVQGYETTEVEPCQRNAGDLPLNVHVEGCETPPCTFLQTEYAVLNLVFPAPRTMLNMTTYAWASLVAGFGINYDLGPESQTCNFITNSYCPIMEGEVLFYSLRMYIEEWFFAGTAATIEFYIQDENRLPVVCLRTNIRIASPSNIKAKELEEVSEHLIENNNVISPDSSDSIIIN